MTLLLPATADACLRQVAAAQVEGRLPSLVAGVARDGELAWSGGRGATAADPDAGPGPEPTTDTQYRMGSITKTFTALLVLQLRDEGLLSLDDPLDAHLPGTAVGGLRIRALLGHVSGLGREPAGAWWERNPGVDGAALVAAVPGAALPPDRRFHYSNLAYGLLGEVVARLREASWADVLRARILDPLGLHRTTRGPVAPAATGYSVHPWADTVVAEPAPDAAAMAPAGQLWTTVADLARYAAFLADPDPAVISADTLDEACAPGALRHPDAGWDDAYGLGFAVSRSGGRVLVGHGGSMPGFLAGLAVDRAAKVGAVTFANSYTGYAPVEFAADLVTTVLDAEPPLPPAWRPVASVRDDVAELLGAWFWGYVEMRVTAGREPGDLLVHSGRVAGNASRMRPDGADGWRGVDGDHGGEVLRVVRDDGGAVHHLDLSTYLLSRAPYGVV